MLSTLSRPLLTLSQPLKHSQGLCSLQALSWLVRDNSQELSQGCESVGEAVRVLYTLAASLGSLTITMGTLTAFTSTLLASTTLTRPTLILMGLQTLSLLCNSLKASSGTLTIQALSLSLQAFL